MISLSEISFWLKILDILYRYDLHDELWWRTTGEYAPLTLFLRCNDVFYWGSADHEQLTQDHPDLLEKAIQDVAAIDHYAVEWGSLLFIARVRGMRPQGAAYPKNKDLWPLLDACGPERETGLGNPCKPGEYGC